MDVFNNYRSKLPGDRDFEEEIRDQYTRTYAERDPSYRPHFKSRNLTPKEFHTLILNVLIETGVNRKEIKEKNKRIMEIEGTIGKLGKSEGQNEQGKKLSQELSRVIAELHYDAAPAFFTIAEAGILSGRIDGIIIIKQ
ncbi:MAG: hypothetical protein ABIJ84_00120 [bacterium]